MSKGIGVLTYITAGISRGSLLPCEVVIDSLSGICELLLDTLQSGSRDDNLRRVGRRNDSSTAEPFRQGWAFWCCLCPTSIGCLYWSLFNRVNDIRHPAGLLIRSVPHHVLREPRDKL